MVNSTDTKTVLLSRNLVKYKTDNLDKSQAYRITEYVMTLIFLTWHSTLDVNSTLSGALL